MPSTGFRPPRLYLAAHGEDVDSFTSLERRAHANVDKARLRTLIEKPAEFRLKPATHPFAGLLHQQSPDLHAA